jgi:hypothetical protein
MRSQSTDSTKRTQKGYADRNGASHRTPTTRAYSRATEMTGFVPGSHKAPTLNCTLKVSYQCQRREAQDRQKREGKILSSWLSGRRCRSLSGRREGQGRARASNAATCSATIRAGGLVAENS